MNDKPMTIRLLYDTNPEFRKLIDEDTAEIEDETLLAYLRRHPNDPPHRIHRFLEQRLKREKRELALTAAILRRDGVLDAESLESYPVWNKQPN